jgi:predicted ATPase
MELRGIGKMRKTLWLSEPPSPADEQDVICEVTDDRYGYKVDMTHVVFPISAKDDLEKLVGDAALIIEEEQSRNYEDIGYGCFGIPQYDDLS